MSLNPADIILYQELENIIIWYTSRPAIQEILRQYCYTVSKLSSPYDTYITNYS